MQILDGVQTVECRVRRNKQGNVLRNARCDEFSFDPDSLFLSLFPLCSRNVLHLQLFARAFGYAVTTQSGSAQSLGKTIVSTCNPGPCFNLKEPWYAADCIA